MAKINFRNDKFLKNIDNFRLNSSKTGFMNYSDLNNSTQTDQEEKIIDFQSYKNELHVKQSKNNVNLSTWIGVYHSDDELKELFINMDLAMKYVHEKGYCVKSFNPKDIEILNNSLRQIKYNILLEMPNNLYDQKELIKEDIYSSSFLQIGIYTKCLPYMNPTILKNDFDSFAIFLPSDDIPYYRGIVQRGASIYLSEYVEEKKRRDLKSLENEVGDTSNSNQQGRSLVKTNGKGFGNYDLVDQNTKINESIYSQLINKEAAFINYVLFPVVIIVLGFIVGVLIYISNFS